MIVEHMLTTIDNPYNPVTDYDEWYQFDAAQGYHTPGYLARVVMSSDDLPEELHTQAIEDAIDEIVKEDPTGLYRKVRITIDESVDEMKEAV